MPVVIFLAESIGLHKRKKYFQTVIQFFLQQKKWCFSLSQLLSRAFYLFFSWALLSEHMMALGLTRSFTSLFLFLYSAVMTEYAQPSGHNYLYLTLSFGSRTSNVCNTLIRGSHPSQPWMSLGSASPRRSCLLGSSVTRHLTWVGSVVGLFSGFLFLFCFFVIIWREGFPLEYCAIIVCG